MKMIRRGLLLLLVLVLWGCEKPGTGTEEPVTRTIEAMDTHMTLTAYGPEAEDALEAALEEIRRLDGLLSVGSEESLVSQINREGQGTLSDTAGLLLERAMDIAAMTEGAFNPLMQPVMAAWGFTTKEYRVPAADELERLRPLPDITKLHYDKDTKEVRLDTPGMQLDFGGIAKGYTSGQLMELLAGYDVTGAMVNLGGNVQLYHTKPDGSLWKVGIQDPKVSDGYVGILETSDRAVITSGGYERYFEADGRVYHHIMDPETMCPADSGLLSVTIVSEDAALADGLSTALFVMGEEKAKEFWQAYKDRFDMILVTEDGTVEVTAGIAGEFSSDYEVEIIGEKP